jgi:AhpD family alkylhydroperoxidase
MKERISFAEMPSGLIEAMIRTETYVNQCGFDIKLVELIRYRVSQLNGCAYCLDRHYKEGVDTGKTPMRLYALPGWSGAHFYSDKERAALRWADAVTLLAQKVIDEQLFHATLEYVDKNELANLTLLIAQINAWNRLARPFAFRAGEFEAA